MIFGHLLEVDLCKMWNYCKCNALEPGWEHVTLEFSNTTPLPAKIYANEGVAQFIFLKGNEKPVTYANRKGKYMKQKALHFLKFNLFNAKACNNRSKRVKWKNFYFRIEECNFTDFSRIDTC